MTKKKPYRRIRMKLDPAGEAYPLPMRGLLSIGKPKAGMTYTEWAEQLRGYVPELIRMVLDPDLNDRPEHDKALWAPVHALCVLTKLAAAEAVEPLLAVLDWDDDWLTHELTHFYGAVGSAAVPPLEDYLATPDKTEPAQGLVLSSLGEIALTHPDQRSEVVRFLTAFLDRPGADAVEAETLTAWAIVELGELQAAEALPAIRRAFDEERVNTTIVEFEDIERMMSETLEDSSVSEVVARDDDFESNFDEAAFAESPVVLTLKCKACGRERNCSFDKVYYDLGTARHRDQTQEEPLIIPERVVCRKCGAVDQYEATSFSTFAIVSKLVALRSGQPDPLPRFELIDFTTERWGWLPPREALSRYASEVDEHPDDVSLRIEYGNSLWLLGYREQAAEQYEQALMTNPNATEALFSLAQLKAVSGSIPDAIAAWEAIQRKFDQLVISPDKRESRRLEVDNTLAELRTGMRPDYKSKPIVLSRPGETAPPQSVDSGDEFEARYQSAPVRPPLGQFGKVGRNEPCPCGSGKKYKQCHGRK